MASFERGTAAYHHRGKILELQTIMRIAEKALKSGRSSNRELLFLSLVGEGGANEPAIATGGSRAIDRPVTLIRTDFASRCKASASI